MGLLRNWFLNSIFWRMSRLRLLCSSWISRLLLLQPKRIVDVSFVLLTFFFKLTEACIFPNLLFDFDLFDELSNFSRVLSVGALDQFFDVGKASDGVHDKEVVHNVRVISLQGSSIWTNDDWINSVNFLEFIVIVAIIFFFLPVTFFVVTFIENSSFLLVDFFSENTHSKFS